MQTKITVDKKQKIKYIAVKHNPQRKQLVIAWSDGGHLQQDFLWESFFGYCLPQLAPYSQKGVPFPQGIDTPLNSCQPQNC